MADTAFDKAALLDTEMQLSRGKLLYLYGDAAFICSTGDQYDSLELNEIEYDVVDAINRLHLMRGVWEFIQKEYGIEADNAEAEEVFFAYVKKLIDSGMISEGSFTKPVFGESGKCFPFAPSFELTDKCNFKCRHCYKEADGNKRTFIDAERLIRFIDYLGDKPYSYELTGGEATLHPDFARIVMAIPEGKCSLLTNGSMLACLPEDVLKRLRHIQLTVYGCTDEEYRSEALSACFADVCRGISRINELEIPNTITVIVRSSNYARMDEYFDLFSKLGVKHVKFGLATETGRNLNGAWSLSRGECERFGSALDRIKAEHPGIEVDEFDVELDNDKPPLPVKDTYTIACGAGTRSITVSERGFVRPCNMMPADCFGDFSIEDYMEHIERGESLPFDKGIARCVKAYRALGKNVDSICPRGFV